MRARLRRGPCARVLDKMLALRQLKQLSQSGRAMSTVAPLKATLFPGDGVGPEICDAVSLMLKTAGVPVEWDVQLAAKDKPDPRTNSFITRENLDSVKVGCPCQLQLVSATIAGSLL